MDVLVIAAHPDDEVLGCGGTLARFSSEGHTVSVAILGEGFTSRWEPGVPGKGDAVDKLRKDCENASKMLGVKDLFFYQFPDNRFDTVPLLHIVKTVEELVSKLRPNTVFTHHGGDLNIDHVITARAVLTALRPLPGCIVRDIYAFEIPSSTEWSFGFQENVFAPNTFVDISKTLKTKVQAMHAYSSEVRQFPHPRSVEGIKAIAEKWGCTAGFAAAEAFCLLRGLI